MINKRILVPVLALVACGLPAGATIVPYCNVQCGGNTTAAFASIVSTDNYNYASVDPITFTGSLSDGGLQYVDAETQVMFAAASAFTITGADGLEQTSITITIPAAYAVAQLSISAASGSVYTCFDQACDGGSVGTSPFQLDYVNTTPGSQWIITIYPINNFSTLIINSFDPAGAPLTQADTPEVGTILLIGAGLISMRWIKRVPRRIFHSAPRFLAHS